MSDTVSLRQCLTPRLRPFLCAPESPLRRGWGRRGAPSRWLVLVLVLVLVLALGDVHAQQLQTSLGGGLRDDRLQVAARRGLHLGSPWQQALDGTVTRLRDGGEEAVAPQELLR